jgi:hypothetical protein
MIAKSVEKVRGPTGKCGVSATAGKTKTKFSICHCDKTQSLDDSHMYAIIEFTD